jgi:hypothetical protein
MPCAINKDECRCVSSLYHQVVSVANPSSWAVQRRSALAPLQNFIEKRPQKPEIVMIEAERSEGGGFLALSRGSWRVTGRVRGRHSTFGSFKPEAPAATATRLVTPSADTRFSLIGLLETYIPPPSPSHIHLKLSIILSRTCSFRIILALPRLLHI